MWREKIIEAKKALGKTAREMAEKTNLSEKTVHRILHDSQKIPRVDDVIALGATVNLSPRELFEEASAYICDQDVKKQAAEADALREEIAALKAKVDELKDEIIRIHGYYTRTKE